jgi:predicted ester cyclase
MSGQNNAVLPEQVALLARILDEGFAKGDTTVIDQVCGPDMVEHQFGLAGAGAVAIEHLKSAILDVHRMAPDLTYTIQDWAIQGDRVWVRAVGRGTATGPFFGPPSGRPIELTVIDVARISDGRIVEHWGVPDRFALLAQTGVLDRLRPPQP